MLFPTLSFAVFFSVVFLVYWLSIAALSRLRRYTLANAVRKWILLFASYAFYAFWDWRFLPLLIASSSLNFVWGLLLARGSAKYFDEGGSSRSPKKFLLVLALASNLLVLIFFKYSNWLLANFNGLLNWFEVPIILAHYSVILPLGISFFTFQNIGYIVDVYGGDMRPTRSYLDYSLYICFFPQLIAGPIIRAKSVLPQLLRLPDTSNIYYSDAVVRIFFGLVKKLIIANTLSTGLVDDVFLDPGAYSSLTLLTAMYAYAVVIYCDFSAYSDMAVGLGLLCGVRLMENFAQPYSATSVRGFWKGWHISLSTWLRDYLYIPLGGSRHGKVKQQRNLLLTMGLGGLWHGASWLFLLWGLMHGLALTYEHLRSSSSKRRKEAGILWLLSKLWGWFATFHFVCFTWLFFRAPSLGIATAFLSKLLSFSNQGLAPSLGLFWMMIGLGLLPQIFLKGAARLSTRFLDSLPWLLQLGLVSLAFALLQVFLPEGVAPFIYYQF